MDRECFLQIVVLLILLFVAAGLRSLGVDTWLEMGFYVIIGLLIGLLPPTAKEYLTRYLDGRIRPQQPN